MGQELRPLDYCQAFVDSSAVLAMRYHSLVFALGLGVPAVAIDYTLGRGKVDELAKRFQIPYRSLDELSTEYLVEELLRVLTAPHPAPSSGLNPQFANRVSESIGALFAARRSGVFQ